MYIDVHGADELAAVFERSDEKPVLLFVFDPFCPTNIRARNELDQLEHDIYVVDVAAQHALGTAIQLYTRVRHESPQLLILSRKSATWHASHGNITARRVMFALAEAA